MALKPAAIYFIEKYTKNKQKIHKRQTNNTQKRYKK